MYQVWVLPCKVGHIKLECGWLFLRYYCHYCTSWHTLVDQLSPELAVFTADYTWWFIFPSVEMYKPFPCFGSEQYGWSSLGGISLISSHFMNQVFGIVSNRIILSCSEAKNKQLRWQVMFEDLPDLCFSTWNISLDSFLATRSLLREILSVQLTVP